MFLKKQFAISSILLFGIMGLIVCGSSRSLSMAGKEPVADSTFVSTGQYKKVLVEGWVVYVNQDLFDKKHVIGKKAIRLLENKLYEIVRMVPGDVCAKLKNIPIWLGVNDGHAPCAEYHPSRQWLSENGYNPDKAKSVEIGNAELFLEWSRHQPSMVLHELAHGYHDQVLGWEHQGIKEAYQKALKNGRYDRVLHIDGTEKKAYAHINEKEYFAEGSEAYFGTNDFYPFVRAELQEHDLELYKVMGVVWK